MNIDEMQAGRDLDVVIHNAVMGLMSGTKEFSRATGFGLLRLVPHYSTDLSEAWRILDRFSGGGWTYSITNGRGDGLIGCALLKDTPLNSPHRTAVANTVPLAICRAALKVVGE